LSSSEPQPANPDAALIDRVAALEVELADRRAEVEQYREQVESFDARMADRDDKLRRYREALADLRAALEAENHPALSGE
jgi:chromosome segregation ATPase